MNPPIEDLLKLLAAPEVESVTAAPDGSVTVTKRAPERLQPGWVIIDPGLVQTPRMPAPWEPQIWC